MNRRTNRLFQIVQILRGRRVTTAALLAERLEVSKRMIYRDINDLSLPGVPIEGEVGSGYRLMAGLDLSPLMLTHHESEALMVAIRLLKIWGGDSLSQVLESAQEKVSAVLSPESWRRAEQTRISAPDFGNQPHSRSAFDLIHRAVSAQQVLALHYCDESGNLSWRGIQPLGLFFWGEHWLLVGWCEKRDDYHCFRVDRCLEITLLDRHSRESADRSLSGFLRKVRCKDQP